MEKSFMLFPGHWWYITTLVKTAVLRNDLCGHTSLVMTCKSLVKKNGRNIKVFKIRPYADGCIYVCIHSLLNVLAFL